MYEQNYRVCQLWKSFKMFLKYWLSLDIYIDKQKDNVIYSLFMPSANFKAAPKETKNILIILDTLQKLIFYSNFLLKVLIR